ncbi:peptidylprolyl isomerase [uncultured Paracoccus sp.]|uniref:peptidylprolyl isomerase n=1 Tax=uncultured Paracoccus sp. TaxID=189685 RepID=UPI0025E09390|nr:peptidylprolyl isomerase [uncultured Paracoccus sp.]
MRRAILGAAMAAMMLGGQAALAQSNPFRPVVYVNDSVVTEFDIQQRARFLQLLQAPDTSRAAAERAVIEDRLRMQAADSIGIRPTDEAIDEALAEFAGRGGLDTAQFEQLLRQNGVDPQIYHDFIVSGVVWRDVVRARVVPTVRVSDAEVEQEFQKIVQTPRVTDVLLSELIIPAPEGQEAQAMGLAEDILANVSSESEFAAAARQYSAVQSREEGGRLPWTPLANLPPSLQPIVLSLQPGSVSQPLTVPGAVVLFMLRDTRGVVRSGARDQVLEYVHLRHGDPAEAARIAATVRSCGDLFVRANGLPADRLVHETRNLGAIPQNIGLYLASLDDDEATAFGGEVVMLCKRTPALMASADEQPQVPVAPDEPAEQAPDSNALPDLDTVRNVVFNRKISNAADAYLAELQANAIIRR